MPCYSPQGEGSTHDSRARSDAKRNAKKIKEIEERLSDDLFATKQRLDEITRLLCGLCTHLEASGRSGHIDRVDGLRDWWETHKEWDERRKQR